MILKVAYPQVTVHRDFHNQLEEHPKNENTILQTTTTKPNQIKIGLAMVHTSARRLKIEQYFTTCYQPDVNPPMVQETWHMQLSRGKGQFENKKYV